MMFNNVDGITIEEHDLRYCFPTSSSLPPNHEQSSLFSNDGVPLLSSGSSASSAPQSPGDQANSKIIRSGGFDFVRQPCKARGIEIQSGQNPHVARFAYIDIPVGTKCGTVLSCSHPVCMASGRRFRYCTHCKTAVAKRNFNVRHAHTDLSTIPTSVILLPPKQHLKLQFQPPHQPQHQPNKSYSSVASEFTETVDTTGQFEITDVSSSIEAHSNYNTTASSADSISRNRMPLSAQELAFISLLRSRPGDEYPDELEKWKIKLLTLTEKKKRAINPEITKSRYTSSNSQRHQTPDFTPYDLSDNASVSSFDMEEFENFEFPVGFFEG